MDKKYQVFISSTYTDLKDERKVAVETILTDGHIPTGMEQFHACDRSQFDIIKKWIDDSDVYVLILGGRYGTLMSEHDYSYTEAEFRYVLEREKPCFALVMNMEEITRRRSNSEAIDLIDDNDHMKNKKIDYRRLEKWEEFYNFVINQRVVRFFDSPTSLALGLSHSLNAIIKEDIRLKDRGWVPYHYMKLSQNKKMVGGDVKAAIVLEAFYASLAIKDYSAAWNYIYDEYKKALWKSHANFAKGYKNTISIDNVFLAMEKSSEEDARTCTFIVIHTSTVKAYNIESLKGLGQTNIYHVNDIQLRLQKAIDIFQRNGVEAEFLERLQFKYLMNDAASDYIQYKLGLDDQKMQTMFPNRTDIHRINVIRAKLLKDIDSGWKISHLADLTVQQ